MKRFLSIGAMCLISLWNLHAQSIEERISQVTQRLVDLESEELKLSDELVTLKEQKVVMDLKDVGIPASATIFHRAMALEYSEEHEQAKWVAHIILPDIAKGTNFRSNDFRVDDQIATGTTDQEDYFLTDTLEDGTVEYDGYGYDRGHLAPSADFRWSADALSESYYYSNMSPQSPAFNRGKWAELEGLLRNYVMTHEAPLYVFTAPVLHDELLKVERSPNELSIPEYYIKIAYDPRNNIGIAFMMPNQELIYPLESFVVSIKEAEEALGFQSFSSLSDELKGATNKKAWFKDLQGSDVEPLDAPSLPPGYFNTVQAKFKIGSNANICGTVVATRYSRSGNLWINVDKQFPNQIFSAYIRKEDLVNFSSKPETLFDNQSFCFSGKVEDLNGVATICIKREEDITLLE